MPFRLPSTVSARLFLGVILAGTLSVLDSTIIVPLLGTIGNEFDAGSEVSWLVAAYLLGSTVTIPIWGRWMDLRGERNPMWASLLVFLTGTLMGALAPSITVLIFARLIQGIGVGGLAPLGQAILAARCSSTERARLQIFYNVAYGTAAGLGPIVAGALVHVSWRWAFWLIVPAIVAVGIALYGEMSTTPAGKELRPFDKIGSALVTLGLTALLLGIERGWWWTIAAGAAALVVFVRHSRRQEHGLVPRSVLLNRTIIACASVSLIIGFLQFSYLTYLPLFSQEIYPGLNSGLVVVPLTLLWMTLGAVTGILAIRVGVKLLTLLALILAIPAGILVAIWFTMPSLFIAATLIGAMSGLALLPALLLAQRSAPLEDIGAATSALVLVRNFGAAVGVAVTAVVLAGHGRVATMWMLAALAVVALIPNMLLPNRSSEAALMESSRTT